MADDQFYLVCAAFFEQRLLDHLAQQRDGENVEICVLSSNWSALSLNGQKARDVLAACTDADLSLLDFAGYLRSKSLSQAMTSGPSACLCG